MLQQSVQCGEGFYAVFTLGCKIETNLGIFLQLYYAKEEEENKYCVFYLQTMLEKSKLVLCVQYVFKKTVI